MTTAKLPQQIATELKKKLSADALQALLKQARDRRRELMGAKENRTAALATGDSAELAKLDEQREATGLEISMLHAQEAAIRERLAEVRAAEAVPGAKKAGKAFGDAMVAAEAAHQALQQALADAQAALDQLAEHRKHAPDKAVAVGEDQLHAFAHLRAKVADPRAMPGSRVGDSPVLAAASPDAVFQNWRLRVCDVPKPGTQRPLSPQKQEQAARQRQLEHDRAARERAGSWLDTPRQRGDAA